MALGGNYEDVLGRLRSERLIQKFVLKFLEDENFDLLCRSLEEGLCEEAFRAAHTIKGLCLNLGFTKLAESSTQISEALRGGDLEGAKPMLGRVHEDYERTADAVRAYQAGLSQ